MKPKKSLGQNFLRDNEVLEKIIASADLKLTDFVVEIGPGEGVLSTKLNKKAEKLIMIEKDVALAEKMASDFQFSICNFQSLSNDPVLKFKNKAVVITGDILEINLPKIIEKNNFQNYKVIANIPYYITSPIIQLFLETTYPPEEMVLMVQKEVAERICAQTGQMSILALSVQYYAKPEIVFYVDKKSFFPAPKVDSAVIKISAIKNHQTEKEKTKATLFFKVIKAGFSAKRKILTNNLSNSLHIDKEIITEKLRKIKINPTQRAQELSVQDWKKLAELLSTSQNTK